MATLLDTLRQTTKVDCDTLDSRVAKDLGPFVDCTSNQAIAFFELSRPANGRPSLYYADLIAESVEDARETLGMLRGTMPLEEFVIEILMVKLQLLIIPNLTGFVHVQTNPKFSYSTSATVENAERIVEIFKTLAPEIDPQRVCIKIPSTWEGLQACRILEDKGIATLATTMFCMEQAALAADAGCTYIAPYVNELKVHFEPGYVDENKAFDFCREAQAYYITHSHRPQVLAASLTSIHDVMHLSGIQHITVSPALLRELASSGLSAWGGKPGEYFSQDPDKKSWETRNYPKLVQDEAAWKLAFTRSGFGASQGKIISAINYFCDFQDKLENLVKLRE